MVRRKFLWIVYFSLFMTTFANASLTTTVNSVLDLIDKIQVEHLKAGERNPQLSECEGFYFDIANLRTLYASLLSRPGQKHDHSLINPSTFII